MSDSIIPRDLNVDDTILKHGLLVNLKYHGFSCTDFKSAIGFNVVGGGVDEPPSFMRTNCGLCSNESLHTVQSCRGLLPH